MKIIANQMVLEVDSLPTNETECLQELYRVQSMFENKCFCRFHKAQWGIWEQETDPPANFISVWHNQICPFARMS